jgi:hypothetical protein
MSGWVTRENIFPKTRFLSLTRNTHFLVLLVLVLVLGAFGLRLYLDSSEIRFPRGVVLI